MNTKTRIIIWVLIVILLLISVACMTYQIGKKEGINQAYDEIASKNIILENSQPKIEKYEDFSEIPLQQDISRENCVFENGVKKCQDF